MDDDNWKEQYQEWKVLKPFQLKLLNEGAKNQSQAWLINSMWCDWKDMKKLKENAVPKINSNLPKDPWEE